MTVQEIIDALQVNGWRLLTEDGDSRLFQQESTGKVVTLSGKSELRLPPGVFQSFARTAGLPSEES